MRLSLDSEQIRLAVTLDRAALAGRLMNLAQFEQGRLHMSELHKAPLWIPSARSAYVSVLHPNSGRERGPWSHSDSPYRLRGGR